MQEEEEEEEPPVVETAGPAIQQQQQQVESRSQTPKPVPARPAAATSPNSRATSPTLSPGHGGHSVVAKRATSPKIPKPKTANTSRGNSPLGGQSTFAGSRGTSPVAEARNGVLSPKTGMKRKADDTPTTSPTLPATTANGNNPVPKAKKRKAPPTGAAPIAISSAELEAALLSWLKNTTNATTRDCIHHFTPYLTDQDKKAEFSNMVRKHAQLRNSILVLRTRSGSSAPSPPAN